MSSNYKDRYGIPGVEVKNLIRRYYRYLSGSDWEKADDFLKWASQSGYQNGLRLKRRDKEKPHGPNNSFFSSPKTVIADDDKAWKRRWIENWNNNIHILADRLPQGDPVDEKYFRYELQR